MVIMLSEARWHNEGIITNYAGLCFHTFMTIRCGSGRVVTDFRQSPKRSLNTDGENSSSFVAHLCISSRIQITEQQQMHGVELRKQCPVTGILHGSKRRGGK